MPKQVDHEERRRQIAEALWRSASDRGLEAVSMREVATEAGVSIGLVQHYFKTKDQMLVFATGYLKERVDQRIQQRVAAAPDPRTPLSLVEHHLSRLSNDTPRGLMPPPT